MLADCTSLKSVVLPITAEAIEPYAFSYCTSLTDICISDSLATVGEFAFRGCRALRRVTYDGSRDTWFAIELAGGNDDLANSIVTFTLEQSEDDK